MLDGISVTEGATYTPAGGSDVTFDLTGEQVANGVVLGNMDEEDFFSREKLYATVRMPALQGDGEYSKQKNSVRIVRPATLASGKVVYNLIRIETEVHPESGVAEVDNLLTMGMSLINSSDAELFWHSGSLK